MRGGVVIFKHRRIIQFFVAFIVYIGISYLNFSIFYVVLFGSVLGIVFGKVFCRWMCPIGFFMELIMKRNKDREKSATYQYYKLGCPISWISGFLNKYSFFKINFNSDTCIKCGKCDDVCYITSLNKDYSLYKKKKLDPADSYSCSKCMDCITVCPVDSLKFSKRNKTKN